MSTTETTNGPDWASVRDDLAAGADPGRLRYSVHAAAQNLDPELARIQAAKDDVHAHPCANSASLLASIDRQYYARFREFAAGQASTR